MSSTYFLLIILCCQKVEEFPLILPPGAEPSAKSHNDYGIEDFRLGQYYEAFLHFKQANTADSSAGEIYFNMGLANHMQGRRDRATENFRKARKFAHGNTRIKESKLLKNYLDLQNL